MFTNKEHTPLEKAVPEGYTVTAGFQDPPLWVTASKKCLNILEAIPSTGELSIFEACYEIGRACNKVRDFAGARKYYGRAKRGYEKVQGPESEKALELSYFLILCTLWKDTDERIEKYKELADKAKSVLGEEHPLTLRTLNELGVDLKSLGDYEEARKFLEPCLAGRERVLGMDDLETLKTAGNLGQVYEMLEKKNNTFGSYKRALELHERTLVGFEKQLGKTHSNTLATLVNIACVYQNDRRHHNAFITFSQALAGYETQFGTEHKDTKYCAKNLAATAACAREKQFLKKLCNTYPHILEEMPAFGEFI